MNVCPASVGRSYFLHTGGGHSLPQDVDCVEVSDGDKWKFAREAAGFSVQEAADALDLHRNTIYKLENGDESVTLRLLSRVATLYGQTLGQIYRDANEPERTPREFRPLLEPLRPLTQAQREKIIRNIATNLDFMASTYANAGLSSHTSVTESEDTDRFGTEEENMEENADSTKLTSYLVGDRRSGRDAGDDSGETHADEGTPRPTGSRGRKAKA